MGFLRDLYIIYIEAVCSIFHRKQFDILSEVKTKTNTNTHFSAVKWVFFLFIFFCPNMIFLLTVQ